LLDLLLDCCLEFWRLVDDREAVFIDRLLVRLFECLFIDRNDLCYLSYYCRHLEHTSSEGAHAPATAMSLHRGFPTTPTD